MIISKSENFAWKFKFEVDQNDPFSYITPYNLDVCPTELSEQIRSKENESFSTFFYLPLDKELKGGLDVGKFIQKCIEKLSSNLLLFCQNLNKIEIRNNEQHLIYSKKTDIDKIKTVSIEESFSV